MNLKQHPEYDKYVSDKALTDAVWNALSIWFEENGAAGQGLKTAVSELTTMFQAYNQVMWQEFPFCKMCLGGCCVVGASEVTPIDAAALTVLGHDLPVLPAQTHHNERACIYLGEQGCSWPANWRPLKCMIYFSLGSGNWRLESSSEQYGRLTQALQSVLDKHLPAILGKNSQVDVNELADPIQFASSLSRQLIELFLPQEIRREDESSLSPTDPVSDALLFIAEVTEQVLENPDGDDDVLLADLEQFEWIVTGQPANKREMLAEINGRYAPNSHSNPIHTQFSQQIQSFMQSM